MDVFRLWQPAHPESRPLKVLRVVACANNVEFGARHTKLLRSHSGTGVRVRLLRPTYALLILLSTNGSNKALAVAHRFRVQAVVVSAGGGGVGAAARRVGGRGIRGGGQ